MREVVSCYMIYVIFMIYYECISDSECDIYMLCCQNLGVDYLVCVFYKDYVFLKEKFYQFFSSGQKMYYKDKGYIFYLLQFFFIFILIFEKVIYKSKL